MSVSPYRRMVASIAAGLAGALALYGAACERSAVVSTADTTTTTTTPPPPPSASTHDWPRFGFDVGRSSASPNPTGIDSTNAASLQRHTVNIDGTVDASAIYLHGVT